MARKSSVSSELQRTWALATADGDAAMKLFYETLFDTAPEVRGLFSGVPMQDQGRKLSAAIGLVVRNPDPLESIVSKLEELRARHVEYEVKGSYYDAVEAAMVRTLKTALGNDFTEVPRDAWVGANSERGGKPKGL